VGHFPLFERWFGIILRGTRKTRQRPNPSIRIRNFGQIDGRFYRGGQPRKNQFRDLAALGIDTVVDLRDDPKPYERLCVEASGMRYVNIPMSDTEYPNSEQIETFLRIVTEPGVDKLFVHCAGGRHRAGVIGAVYRLTINRWNYEQVYSEMKSYDFYERWGHAPLKKFVTDYSRRLDDQPSSTRNSDKSRIV